MGTDWPISVSNIEVHLSAKRELADLRCSQGPAGSWKPCEVSQPEPGHVVVKVDKLSSFEGITISGTPTGDTISPGLPKPPTGEVNDPGTGALLPMLATALATLLAAAIVSFFVRRAGREIAWAGGSVDAAFGPQFGEQYPTRLVDHEELASFASTEFAPPKGISAWQGGILHRESVRRDHKVAWLLDRAIAGEIAIEGESEDLTLRRLETSATEPHLLNPLFGGRKSLDLGAYDKQFASGWRELESELKRWHKESEYWDRSGDQRQRWALFLALPLMVLGLIGVVTFSSLANRIGLGMLAGVVVAALLVGAGLALMISRWELRIRTPAGSGLWILIESFRRFIHNSDAQHVDEAAKRGELRDYTAWAVALGEVDRWSKAVKEAQAAGTHIAPQALYFANAAPSLNRATASAATAPSKSGGSSGGGGGGFSGGGGGGGGGGSW